MTWAKIDDRLHSHPKARRAGLEAMGLWVLGLSFCGAYNTDGRISREDVEALGGRRALSLADRLVGAGLWDRTPEGGYAYHDFLAYNPSAAQVEADRARKAEAGRRGGLAKAASASRSHSERLAPASPVLPEPAVLPARPDPVPDQIPPVVPPSGDTTPKAKTKRAKPRVEMPEGWTPTEAHAAKCRAHGLDVTSLASKFRNHHGAKGSVFADWNLAFHTWIDNEIEWQAKRNAGPMFDDRPASVIAEEARRERQALQRVPALDGIGRGGV
jgi:hypothetical protein